MDTLQDILKHKEAFSHREKQ